MKFGENLQKLRKEQGISQEQLAEKLGVTRQSVSKWESGSSYPEMDKIVALCNLFHCDLDVLINKDVTEERQRKDASSVIKSAFQSICDYVKKTIFVFEHKTMKELIKMLAQIFIIICVILCFAIPFVILKEIVISLFYTGDNVFSLFFSKFFEFIFNAGYAILAIAAFLYIFKIKFLDSEEIIEVVEESDESKEVENSDDKEVAENKPKKVKVIKNNSSGFSLLDLFTKAITICIKCILFFLLIPVVIGTIFGIVALVVLLAVMFQGVFLFGPILLLIGIIVFAIVLIEIILDFIFNLKFSKRRIIITILSSIVVSSIGIGLSIWYFLNLTVVDDVPKGFKPTTEEKVYPMSDDFSIHYYDYYNTEFIEDESLQDQVRVQIEYYPSINHVQLEEVNDSVFLDFYEVNSISLKKITNCVIDDLKNGEVHNYNELGRVKMIVTSSKENLEKMNREWDY